MKVAIYTRISDDKAGEGLGVARQEEDCRKKAATLGWTDLTVYSDNDISASKDKVRPAYKQMMQDMAEGKIDGLIVYDLDRLTRKPAELEEFIDLADRHKISLANVSGDVDLTTPNGRMIARIKGAVARQEAERIGERVARQKQQAAEAGNPLASRFRTFGYTRDWKEEPDEAKVVKEMFNRHVKGHSVMSIYEWILTLYPINPVSGKRLSYNAVIQMLGNARYAGFNVYKGEVIGQGTQPALITEQTWDASQQRRTKINKRKAGGFNARKYLLTGFVYCSECYSPMRSHKAGKKSTAYRCTADNGGCGKVGMKLEWVDDAISVALTNRLASTTPAKYDEPVDNSADIERIEQTLAEVQAAIRDGSMSLADALPLMTGLRGDLKDAKAVRGAAEASKRAQRFPAFANIKAWKQADVSQKRALLAEHLKVVVIYPVRHRGQKAPDLHRIEVTWADDVTENLGVIDDMQRQEQVWQDELSG